MRKAIILLIVSITVLAAYLRQATQNTALNSYENKDAHVAAAKKAIKEIWVKDFKTMHDGENYFVLIDVRTVAEYDAGYIPGAVSIPRGVVEFRIGKEEVWDEMPGMIFTPI